MEEDDYWAIEGVTPGRQVRSLTEAEKEAERKRKLKSDKDSKKLGELLLQGWCMLDSYCPNNCLMPLMRDKQKREYCVSCEQFLSEIEEAEDKKVAEAKARTETEQLDNAKQIGKENDREPKIEKEKQKGKEREEETVATRREQDADSHNVHVKRARHEEEEEEEEDQDSGQHVAVTFEAPSRTIAFPTASEAASSTSRPFSVGQPPRVGASVAFPTTPSFLPPPGPSFAPVPGIVGGLMTASAPAVQNGGEAPDLSSYVPQTQQILTRKLEEACQLLAATPVTNTRRCSELVGLVAECAKAIKELDRLY